MEDFTGLDASLVASVGDVRGCVILSRDGLVLGAHPEDGEAVTRSAWLRFAAMGEPERGFIQFGTEIWCYARRGAYAAFVLSGIEARPGLVIDRIDQILLAAEEFRARRDRPRPPEVPLVTTAAPSGKPRTPLHPETPSEQPIVIAAEPEPASAVAAAAASTTAAATEPPAPPASEPDPTPTPPVDPVAEVPAPPATPLEAAPEPGVGRLPDPPMEVPGEAPEEPEPTDSVWAAPAEKPPAGEDEEVDRVMLAREFSQLLQEDSDAADG